MKSTRYHIKKQRHLDLIGDLLQHQDVQEMKQYMQHGKVTTFEHCLRVSYTSYRISKFLGLDYKAAARGGMLHDFFLYDWHKYKPPEGLHGLTHPKRALDNAKSRFDLTDKKEDIIIKHMWPVTRGAPRIPEAWVVNFSDKVCATAEAIGGMASKTLQNVAALYFVFFAHTYF